MTADELRRLAVLIERTDYDAIDRAAAYLRACADAMDAGPVAWAHHDGRVVPADTMQAARKDGGAMLSSLREYTVPLYPVAIPASLRLPEPMTNAEVGAAMNEVERTCEYGHHHFGYWLAVSRAIEAETLRRVKEANE